MGSEISHLRDLLKLGKSAADKFELRNLLNACLNWKTILKEKVRRSRSLFINFWFFKKTNLNFSIEILNIGWSGLTKDKSDEKPHQLHSGRRHTKTQQSHLVQSTMSMLSALMKIMIYFPTWLVQIKLFFK